MYPGHPGLAEPNLRDPRYIFVARPVWRMYRRILLPGIQPLVLFCFFGKWSAQGQRSQKIEDKPPISICLVWFLCFLFLYGGIEPCHLSSWFLRLLLLFWGSWDSNRERSLKANCNIFWCFLTSIRKPGRTWSFGKFNFELNRQIWLIIYSQISLMEESSTQTFLVYAQEWPISSQLCLIHFFTMVLRAHFLAPPWDPFGLLSDHPCQVNCCCSPVSSPAWRSAKHVSWSS